MVGGATKRNGGKYLSRQPGRSGEGMRERRKGRRRKRKRSRRKRRRKRVSRRKSRAGDAPSSVMPQ